MVNSLKSLYEDIYGSFDLPGKIGNLTELGKLLAAVVGRESVWTSHHLNAVMMGYKGFAMTRELKMAIEALGNKRDGANPLKARLVEITVFSVNGHVQPTSIILGQSKRCKGCHALIVPKVPWQQYCGKECPGKPKRKRERI